MKKLKMKKSILLGAVASIVVLGLVGAVIFYHFGFRQRFEIISAAQIRVYRGPDSTLELQQGETLTWTINSTDPQLKTIYIKNVGTVPVTLELGIRTDQLPGGFSETSDYNGTALALNEVRTVVITLTLPTTIGAGVNECDSWIIATPVEV